MLIYPYDMPVFAYRHVYSEKPVNKNQNILILIWVLSYTVVDVTCKKNLFHNLPFLFFIYKLG